jgi:hypothetical protein
LFIFRKKLRRVERREKWKSREGEWGLGERRARKIEREGREKGDCRRERRDKGFTNKTSK